MQNADAYANANVKTYANDNSDAKAGLDAND